MAEKRKPAIVIDRDNWQRDAERLRAVNAQLLEALEDVERVLASRCGEYDWYACPSCKGEEHATDCKLAAAIELARKPLPQ